MMYKQEDGEMRPLTLKERKEVTKNLVEGIRTEEQFNVVHKIIDEAMEKKDRYVSLYFGEHGTSVSVYPISEDPEWIVLDNLIYKCSECGWAEQSTYPYCPICGTKLKPPKTREEKGEPDV